MKKVLALTLAFLMVLGVLAGCAQPQSTEPPQTSTSTDGTQQGPAEPKNPLETPGELNIMVVQQAGAPLSESMPVLKELAARTNTKLSYTNIAKEDMAQRVQTLITAGKLPDVVEYITSDQASELKSYLDSGTFLYLQDMITPELTPNLYAFMEENPAYKKDITSDDGKISGIAQATARQWRCDWIVNNTFLTELNMEAPKDLDTLYSYLVAVKEKYPDAVPMGVGPWAGNRNAIIQPIMYAYNVTNEWWLYNDGQYLYGPYEKQAEYKAALQYLNKLYTEKLIDQEFFSISAEATNAKISNNQVGILYGWDDGYGQWGKDGTWGIDMIPSTPIVGPDGKAYIRGNPRMATQVQYITKNCKDPERAMAFFDYCFSEEGVDLLNWGIEGTDWIMLNGERAYTDEIMKHESGYVIGRYIRGLAHPRVMTVMDAQAELMLNGAETAKHVEYMSLPNSVLFPGIPALSATPEEEEAYKAVYTDISATYKEYEAKLITGSPADFDAVFAEYMAKLESLKAKDMCEIRHAQYERYKNR